VIEEKIIIKKGTKWGRGTGGEDSPLILIIVVVRIYVHINKNCMSA
jgi:hypothetical protein